MNRSSIHLLSRLVCYLLVFIAAIAAVMIIFLSQLDINDYRLSLEQQLSSALKQPVQIGHSALTFNRGIALALKDLKIGPEHAVLVNIPHITATLKIAPLLHQQFILDQVQIKNPEVQLWLPFPERPAKGTSHQLVNSLGIRILSVNNGKVTIFQKHDNKTTRLLTASNLHAILRGWKPEKTGELVVSGQLKEQGADFLLETRLPSSRDPAIWRDEDIRVQLKVTHFSTRKSPLLVRQISPETIDLNLSLEGVPTTGTRFNTTLTNSANNKKFFSLAGRWTSSSQQDSLTKLSGKLLDIPLNGEFRLFRQAKKHFLTGRFGAENVKLSPQLLRAWHIPNADKLIYGELDQLIMTLEKSWKPEDKISGMPRIDAEVTICNLDWDTPELKQLQDLSLKLSLKNKNLQIRDGVLIADKQLIDFSGQINSLFRQPKIDLKLNFNPRINDFISQVSLPHNWKMSGNIPGSLTLTGPFSHPDFLLQGNLNSTKFQFGKLFHKQATDQAEFQLQGHLADHKLQFNHFSLKLKNVDISGAGYFQQVMGKQSYDFSLKPIDLETLKPFSPLLRQFRVRGKVEPAVSQQQSGLHGTLKLKNLEAHLTSVISDLNRTTGTIALDQHGFTFQNLVASLGKSDFLVTGTFTDWQNPQLNLDISGKKIRAQDLVFINQQQTLHDLDGHLQINSSGISFSPVKVRLEKNTLATVNGKVSDFSNPRIALDIQSDQVDVLDIINLFVSPKKTPVNNRNHSGGPPLRINVSAKQGTLGGLRFQNVAAVIRGDNNRLTIFPLRFDNGKGWCQARIEFNYREQVAPLKVSGHAEEINASILHQDLFERPGLVNGDLRGDFYIEGNPGNDQFWQGAKGGIHIQISNGTLKKFHGLAKVFSILNVSQIFSGKLPDMDKEGMPFTLLESSVLIGAGRATTNDLKVTSEAMNLSVVGSQGLVDDTLDLTLGVMPLRTVDKIITSIPIAGWVLAGEDKALITAHFKIKGTSEEPKVSAVPIGSVSKTVFGIFKRTLGLPAKLAKDIGTLFKKKPEKKLEQ